MFAIFCQVQGEDTGENQDIILARNRIHAIRIG